jgi:hypothetical protein
LPVVVIPTAIAASVIVIVIVIVVPAAVGTVARLLGPRLVPVPLSAVPVVDVVDDPCSDRLLGMCIDRCGRAGEQEGGGRGGE